VKNVQVIDNSQNCTFSVFQMTDGEFSQVFPGHRQDIEFIEDLIGRLGDHETSELLAPVWGRPARKTEIAGLHGTLYYEYGEKRKFFPKSKRESDWDPSSINAAQRKIYAE
jgi:hypothetical protein